MYCDMVYCSWCGNHEVDFIKSESCQYTRERPPESPFHCICLYYFVLGRNLTKHVAVIHLVQADVTRRNVWLTEAEQKPVTVNTANHILCVKNVENKGRLEVRHRESGVSRRARFGQKVCQIGPKWDKSGTFFLDLFSIHFVSPRIWCEFCTM